MSHNNPHASSQVSFIYVDLNHKSILKSEQYTTSSILRISKRTVQLLLELSNARLNSVDMQCNV